VEAGPRLPTLAEELTSAPRPDAAPPVAIWFEASSRPVTPKDIQALADETPGADIVVVGTTGELETTAIEGLSVAAYSDPVCATVSQLGERAAPRLPAVPPPAVEGPEWGCVYIRRDAFDFVVGEALALGVGPSTPRSLREVLGDVLSRPGLVHRGIGPAVGGAGRAEVRRSEGGGEASLVTIDMRHLDGPVTGTQVQALALLDALSRLEDVRMNALVPARLHPSVVPLVEPLRDRVTLSSVPVESGVFYRPHQVGSLNELVECLSFAPRFVLTHQDMIGDRTPAYFASNDDWAHARRTTRASLGAADQLGFFSRHAALDAASDGADPTRSTIVPLGVDHITVDGPSERPAALSQLHGRPFVLVLGTSYQHKNRVFALRVARELIVERGWEGGFVLAGRDVPLGSSVPQERAILASEPRLRERVVVIDHVSERAKRGLYRDAALVLFPSLYEGFGLVPFEAAAFGTPCLYSWRGALSEFLPSSGALPADLSVFSSAGSAERLLDSVFAREAVVADIRAASALLTWDRTARGYAEIFRRALEASPTAVDREVLAGARIAGDGIPISPAERALVRAYRRRPHFRKLTDAVIRARGVTSRAARLGRDGKD
jgi:glycosyltransferase involved in cell wall biosynthesis